MVRSVRSGQILCAISGGSVSLTGLRSMFEGTECSESVDDDETRKLHAEIIANLPTLLEAGVGAGFLTMS